MNGIKALTFDVFGTVVDWRSSVAEELRTFFEPRRLSRDWFAFIDDWRELYQPAMEDVRSQRRSFVILDVLHRENLIKLLEKYEIHGLSEDDILELNTCWHRLKPWPDSVDGLLELRKSFTLATLSNGNMALMTNLARHSALPWHMILGAEFAQAYKPDPRTYLCTASALGLEPCQCMMVAAHNKDLRAARELGFKTAYVNRPTEYGPGQTTDLGPEENWDIVCESMVELADFLKQ
ncbi:haloacid dehalogenase type II [Ruegeria sp. R13_0]|uniref:haloacid dehalogenase type II n=1 Tax=Ruegeria sp. R13_0 TaxID=2821099 RepID=UPI001ADB43CC|nr:haloacid dehalogenase type II [Ruegeria sp. R13_0]MBO9436896.1 haloacid dehalogenase type II [Ruegeria sp. R13_0]